MSHLTQFTVSMTSLSLVTKEMIPNGKFTDHEFIGKLMLFAALAHGSLVQCGTNRSLRWGVLGGLSWGIFGGLSLDISVARLCDHPHFFLFAGPAQSGERKNLATRLAVGAAKRRRCSTTWLTSCLYPTASALTWTRPPSWGSPSASCAHTSCSPQVRTEIHTPHYYLSKCSIKQRRSFSWNGWGSYLLGCQLFHCSFLLSHLKLEARKPPKETDPIVRIFLHILKWDQRIKATLVNPASCKNTNAF